MAHPAQAGQMMTAKDFTMLGLNQAQVVSVAALLALRPRGVMKWDLPFAVFLQTFSSPFAQIALLLKSLGLQYTGLWRLNKTSLVAFGIATQLLLLPYLAGASLCKGIESRIDIITKRWAALLPCLVWLGVNVGVVVNQWKM